MPPNNTCHRNYTLHPQPRGRDKRWGERSEKDRDGYERYTRSSAAQVVERSTNVVLPLLPLSDAVDIENVDGSISPHLAITSLVCLC